MGVKGKKDNVILYDLYFFFFDGVPNEKRILELCNNHFFLRLLRRNELSTHYVISC